MFEAYRQFLLRKASVKTQHIPFYLKWVSDCYGYLNTPADSRLSSEQKNQFLSHMVKSHEDWQVKTGRCSFETLRLFSFKGIETSEFGRAWSVEGS